MVIVHLHGWGDRFEIHTVQQGIGFAQRLFCLFAPGYFQKSSDELIRLFINCLVIISTSSLSFLRR
jgi:hypothetical protein